VNATTDGERVAPLHELLQPGEFLVRIEQDRKWTERPHTHLKLTQLSKVDYPLVSIAALKEEGRTGRFSDVCLFPFRSPAIEEALNERTLPDAERIRRAVVHAFASLADDSLGSRKYRAFVWQRALQ
jgi:xanthine dehydrogenase molybdenum-binding subunit